MDPAALPKTEPVVNLFLSLSAYDLAHRNTFGSIIQEETNQINYGVLDCFMTVVSNTAIAIKRAEARLNIEDNPIGDLIEEANMNKPTAFIHYVKSPAIHGYNIKIYGMTSDDLEATAEKLEKKQKNIKGFYGANWLSDKKRNGHIFNNKTDFSKLKFIDAFSGSPYIDSANPDEIVESKAYKIPVSALHPKCFMKLAFPWENISNIFEVESDNFLYKIGRQKGFPMPDPTFNSHMPAELMAALNPPEEEEESDEEEDGFVNPFKKLTGSKRKRQPSKEERDKKKSKAIQRYGLFPFDKFVDPEIMKMRDTNLLHKNINDDIFETRYSNRPLTEYNKQADEIFDAYWTSPRVHAEMSPALKALVTYRSATKSNIVDFTFPINDKELSILGNAYRNFHSFTKYGLKLVVQSTDFFVCFMAVLNVYNTKRGMHFNVSMSGHAGVGKSFMYNLLVALLITNTWRLHTMQGSKKADFTENPDSYLAWIYSDAPYYFYKNSSKMNDANSEVIEHMKEMLTSSEVHYEFMYDTAEKTGGKRNGIDNRKTARISSIIHRVVFTAQNESMNNTSEAFKDRFYRREIGKRTDDLGARHLQFVSQLEDNSPFKKLVDHVFSKMTEQMQYITAKFMFFMNSNTSRVGMNGTVPTLLLNFLLDKMKIQQVDSDKSRDLVRAIIISESLTVFRIINELFFVKGAKYQGRNISEHDINSEVIREMEKRAVIGVEETLMAINMVSPQWFNIVDRDIILSLRNSIFRADKITGEGFNNSEYLIKYHSSILEYKRKEPRFNIYPYSFESDSDERRNPNITGDSNRTSGKNFNSQYDGSNASIQPVWYDPNYIVVKYRSFYDFERAVIHGFEITPQGGSVRDRLYKLHETAIWPKKYYAHVSEYEYLNAMETALTMKDYTSYEFPLSECPREGITIAKNLTPPNEKSYYKIAISIEYLERYRGFNLLQEIIKNEYPHVNMKTRTIPFVDHDTQKIDNVKLEAKDQLFQIKNPISYDEEAQEWMSYYTEKYNDIDVAKSTDKSMDELVSKWVSTKQITLDKDLEEIAQDIHWGRLGLSIEEREILLNEQNRIYDLN
jgi:hypothetical protein